ncbi:MAG: hypothetical protein LW698_02795 [Planctomycetaceae bacterium]|nr:hypothetical protein [Planctomycetaceae bacterium]
MSSPPAAGNGPAEERFAAPADPQTPVIGTMLSRLVGGSAVSLIGFGVTVLQAILQVPLLLAAWPAETFAAWVTALAMHAFVISCDVGFHSFIGVEITLTGLGDCRPVRQLFGAAVRIWGVFSVLQIAILAAVWFGPDLLAGMDIPSIEILRAARAPFAIFVIQWIFVGSFLSLVCRVLLAGGETIFFQWFGVLHRTLLFAATVTAAWAGAGAGAVAIAYSFAGTLSALLCITYVLRRYPAIVPKSPDGSWQIAWSLFRRSTGLTVSSMLEQSSVGGLTTAVAGVFDDLQTAAFATMRSLANFVTQAAGVVLNPTVPEFGRAATPENIHKAALIIDSALIIGTTVLATTVSVASPWTRALYGAWTRNELPFDTWLFVGLVAAVLIRQVGVPFHCFLHGTNRVRQQFVATAVRASVLFGTLPLAINRLGLSGISTAMVAAEICTAAYLLVVVRQAFREYGQPLQLISPILAAAQTLGAVACLGGALASPVGSHACVGAAIAAHTVLLGLQLRSLPAELISAVITHTSIGLSRTRRRTGRA